MFKQPFQTEDLKSALEKALGFKISSFERIGGGGAINFKAVRESDNLRFVVKCFPPERKAAFEFLSKTLKVMEGVKTPVRLFADTCLVEFADHALMCLAWVDGEVIEPDRLTDEQWQAFLEDYLALSNRMQSIVTNDPVPNIHELWEATRASCHGLGGRILRPVLDELCEDDLDFRPESLRTVHGDFHPGNILMLDGRVECFMDFESLRKGYPAEDICGLLLIAANKMKKSNRERKQRLVSLFRQAVGFLPYTDREWRTALNVLEVKRLYGKTVRSGKDGFLAILSETNRVKGYAILRQQVDAAVNGE